ncbi:hypothetical protein [Lentzea sp. NPDC055074]
MTSLTHQSAPSARKYDTPAPGSACLPNAPVIPKTPAGVADDDSPCELEIPGGPTFAATPPNTCVQSLPDFCHVDTVASEPEPGPALSESAKPPT